MPTLPPQHAAASLLATARPSRTVLIAPSFRILIQVNATTYPARVLTPGGRSRPAPATEEGAWRFHALAFRFLRSGDAAIYRGRPLLLWSLGTPSVPYPLRFPFASKPETIGPVLGVVQCVIAAWPTDQAGVERDGARTGVVTLIQRLDSAPNLNAHFHMRRLDGTDDPALPRPGAVDTLPPPAV